MKPSMEAAMKPIPEVKQPLAIEITEEEILADLLYPARLPSPEHDARWADGHRVGRHPGRINGRANRNLGRGIRRYGVVA